MTRINRIPFKISIGWAVVILFLSALPDENFRPLWMNLPIAMDKLVHSFMYLLLSVLMFIEYESYRGKLLVWKNSLILSSIAFFYGIVIELLQMFIFVGREASWWDVVANATGIILAIIFYNVIRKIN